MMEFFFSKVAGYNLTKKRLHKRFFRVKFVRTCQNGYLQGQFLVNDSVSSKHVIHFTIVFNAVAKFLQLHLDS